MDKNSIKPLGQNVLIRPEAASKKTESGIYLPERASEEKPQQGIVTAVGDAKGIKVKKNDRVIFNRYSGTEVKVAGEEYLIVKNEDILAVVK